MTDQPRVPGDDPSSTRDISMATTPAAHPNSTDAPDRPSRPHPRPTSAASVLEVQIEALVVSRCGVDAVLARQEATHRVGWFPVEPPKNRGPADRQDPLC